MSVVLRSTDGLNWSQVAHTFAASLPAAPAASILRVLGPLYLLGINTGGNKGLACSVDQGATWKPLFNSTNSPVALAASDGQVAYVAGAEGLYLSNMLSL